MVKSIVVARSDGRGGFTPYVKNAKAHAGEHVNIGGREFAVSIDGRVNIPARVMRDIGTLNAEGRYTVVVEYGARHTEGELSQGLYISQPPPSAVGRQTGEIVSDSEYADYPSFNVLQPSDTLIYYVGA